MGWCDAHLNDGLDVVLLQVGLDVGLRLGHCDCRMRRRVCRRRQGCAAVAVSAALAFARQGEKQRLLFAYVFMNKETKMN